ncbi:MAG: hypothetical protein KDE33_23930 [Bacteroidetes bacterium]|nr:hypothetical protein [Bacteroidota bacterium]
MPITITLKIPHLQKELEVTLPTNVTGEKILRSIFSKGYLPNIDPDVDPEFLLYKYDLIITRTQKKIELHETLEEADVLNGDIVILKMDLGGEEIRTEKGKLLYDVPEEIEISLKKRVEVRISKNEFKDYLLKENLIKDVDINEIEIGSVMKVILEENSINKGLIIKKLSNENQLITSDNYTRWIFDVIATRIGLTSLILRISLIEHVEKLGNIDKDVFLIEQEVDVLSVKSQNQNLTEFKEFEEIALWSQDKKETVIRNISLNETGKALSILANHFQKNREIQSNIILLKAQYNQGKNMANLNVIEPTKWWMIQSKINYSILQMINEIEEKSENYEFNDQNKIMKMINELI